jgi:hypothetical protein
MIDEDEEPDEGLYDDFGEDEYFGSDDWLHDKERDERLMGESDG